MSLNNTPSGERIHIGLFGRRNAGKSSLVNALTGQSLAIVSDVRGTTTDPVLKAMELLPLGPVVMIDTPGLDDEGELGELRIRKAYQMLNKADIALLVVDASIGMTSEDEAILDKIIAKNLPYVIVFNKCDEIDETRREEICELEKAHGVHILVSASTGEGIHELKERIGQLVKTDSDRALIRDLIEPSDIVVLVVPIDKAAPKGRLILPQQMVIRDILDAGAVAIVAKEDELANVLDKFERLGEKPRLVVTDSQVFGRVSKETPRDIKLTSFSILMARYKGDLELVVKGARVLDELEDGDRILIAEGCTHHRQCGDIGTDKLPKWILKHCGGKSVNFEWVSGTEFPDELNKYRLVIHCGACMLNEKEMKYRQRCAVDAGVPITNYGTAIAHMNGILARTLEIF